MHASSTLKAKTILVFVLVAISFAASRASGQTVATPPNELRQLQERFQKDYQAIEYLFAHGPAKMVFPPDPRQRLVRWQQDLAQTFARAGATVDEILKLHPADETTWLELRRDHVALLSAS